MATAYIVTDMLSLTMAMFQHTDAWVGVSTPGRMAPQRAAAAAHCSNCVNTSSVANAKLRAAMRSPGAQFYLFPSYADVCQARYDVANPKCATCGGPK